MLITTPMFAIADGVPVRFIQDETGQVRSEYLRLTDCVWVEDFDAVYNVLNGREWDEPTELLSGDLIIMARKPFEECVAALFKKRGFKPPKPPRNIDHEAMVKAAAGPSLLPDDFDPDYSDFADAAMNDRTAADERAWYIGRGFPVPEEYQEDLLD